MDIRIEYFTEPNGDFIALVALLDTEFTAKNGELQKFYEGFNKLDGMRDFFVAYQEEIPVGIAAMKRHDQDAYEVKRVFVKKDYRGLGISKLLMKKLEEKAIQNHTRSLILETSATFTTARNLYRSLGYQDIENYGQYVGMSLSVCMRKEIGE
ncbi:MAG TPA: GNAT family N-acetyltransferase [Firmicutes bacterium]|jgi:putative acetyltransferase|nr:GNAT family N-acetyltransferase [Bacillota bacterium]